MPRGGGGFRGGGFGGGGFRGGGFRGGSRSFRVGSVRSSGRPFGRTGSRRTVSRAPHSRSRSHGGYHPHRRRYWGYWRPWWRRPWGWYWWWGYPYRPWYRAPVYWGGGIVLAIIALLVILPLLSMAFIPFPFTNASSDGTITYRDTQTLYYNEYWYEREKMSTGQQIDYNMQAYSEVTFIIWNQPFENFPATRTLSGGYSESMTVQPNHDYQYIGYFLKPGSTLDYEFTVSGGDIEFFITDANELNRWNNWETIYPDVYYFGSTGADGSYSIPYAQDWYLVWYNAGSTPISIDFTVDYNAVGVYDFSSANVLYEAVDSVSTDTFTVPSDGDWYFFIYFDPFINPSESVEITFDVIYHTDITHEDRWVDFQPVLLIIGGIVVLLLIIAIFQRRSARKTPAAVPEATTTPQPTPPATSAPPSTGVPTARDGQCHRCNFKSKAGDTYCTNCGAKLVGRDYGVTKITTPADEKDCRSCGRTLIPNSRFCKYCGAKVEQPTKTYQYSPDERESFHCQLDGETHPSTDSAYKCEQCSRKICDDCFQNIKETGVTKCPYCKGSLVKIQ